MPLSTPPTQTPLGPAGDNLVNDPLHLVSELLPLYAAPLEHVQQEEMVTNLARDKCYRPIQMLKDAEATARFSASVCTFVLLHHVPMSEQVDDVLKVSCM